MTYPFVSNLEEALAILVSETGEEWTRTRFFDAVVQHALPMSAATPLDARPVMRNTFAGITDANLSFAVHRHLAAMTTPQIADLGIHGQALTRLIAMEPGDAGYLSWEKIKERRAVLNRSAYAPEDWDRKWPDSSWYDGELMGECDFAHFLEPVTVTYDSCRVPRETIAELLFLSDKKPSSLRAAGQGDRANTSNSSIVSTRVIHKIRMNTLDLPIQKAIDAAGSTATGPVYAQLRELALRGETPFSGVVEGDALLYTSDANRAAKLTKEALGRRLDRYRKARPQS